MPTVWLLSRWPRPFCARMVRLFYRGFLFLNQFAEPLRRYYGSHSVSSLATLVNLSGQEKKKNPVDFSTGWISYRYLFLVKIIWHPDSFDSLNRNQMSAILIFVDIDIVAVNLFRLVLLCKTFCTRLSNFKTRADSLWLMIDYQQKIIFPALLDFIRIVRSSRIRNHTIWKLSLYISLKDI